MWLFINLRLSPPDITTRVDVVVHLIVSEELIFPKTAWSFGMSLQDLPSLHGCEVNGGIIEQKPFATKRPSQMGVINFITLDIMILLFFNRSLKISHQKVNAIYAT